MVIDKMCLNEKKNQKIIEDVMNSHSKIKKERGRLKKNISEIENEIKRI